MRYLGGKSKIARRLAGAIRLGSVSNVVIEPFCGGGSMTVAFSSMFDHVIALDVCPDLIIMYNALKEGWRPPATLSEDQYLGLRYAAPSPLRAFAGFGCSFGGKWFGGFARSVGRDLAAESARNICKQSAHFGNVTFVCADYRSYVMPAGCAVYADPPYAGTTEYNTQFNSSEFWEFAASWARTCDVFVSEYKAPPGWRPVLSISRTRDLKSKFTNAEIVMEKLFMRENPNG